jgi:negative regulator of flagellin synthesis FlgM
MKIGHPSDNPVPVSSTALSTPSKSSQSANVAANANAANSAVKGSPTAGVAVTVSTLARTLGAAKSSGAADVDMAKVNEVRTAIKQGTFKVNPEAIADKLLANAEEMLNGTTY